MAALAKQLLTVTVGSLRTDTFEKVLAANAGVLELENCSVTQTGAVVKRNGNTQLTNNRAPSGSMSNTWQMATHQGTLLSFNKAGVPGVAKYSPAMALWEYAPTVFAPVAPPSGPISVSTMPYSGAATQANNADIAVSGNYVAVAYETSIASATEVIIDGLTGKTIATALANARPKVVLQNGCFIFVWVNPFTNNIIFDKWVTSNIGTTSSPTQTAAAAASTHATNPFIDVQISGSDTVQVIYQHSDNTVHAVQYTVSTATAAAPFQLHDSAAATIAATQCLGFVTQSFATSPVVAVADGAAGVKVHVFGSTITSNATVSSVVDAAATTNVRNVTGWTTAAADWVILFDVTAANPWQSRVNAGVKSGASVTTGIWHRGIVLRSKVTNPSGMVDGAAYVVCAYDSTTQPLYVLMPISTDPVTNTYPVASVRFQTWSASGKTEKASCLSSLLAYGSGAIFPSVYKQRLETAAGATYFDYGLSIKTFAFNDANLDEPNEANACTFVPGGIMQCYDGSTYREHTWHTYPEGLSVAFSNAAGGLVAGQTYNWIAVYRWMNAQGQIVRSVPSTVLAATVTAANNTATVTIPNCRLTSFRDNATQIELYRTIAGGTAYFRVGTVQNSFSSATDNSIVDGVSDATLGTGELLYAQPGGVLASQPPPPLSAVDTFDRRLIGIHAEDRTLLVFTNQFVDGICAAFNEALSIRIRDQYGDCTQVAKMDDKWIVFKQNAIYAITGVGPDTSNNGSYNPPQLVAIGDGVPANQVRSVIATSDGIYFLSQRGICLLTRGLQVQFIGQAMQGYTSGFVCTGALQMPDVTQVRWYSAAGTTLVYDYLHQIWGIHTGQPTISSVNWNGLPVLADATGANRYVEAPGTYLERGANYAQKITFPWLTMAGIRGFERFYRLQGIGACTSFTTQVSVTFVYDYDVTTAHTQVTTPPSVLWDWEARPARQVCTALKVTIAGAANSLEGFTCAGFTIQYGVKAGLRPIDKTHRAV